jgi:signal transduction histidine kinase
VVSVIFTLMLLVYFYNQLEVIGPDITLPVVNLVFMQILSFVTYHAHRVTLSNRDLLEELHRTNTELELVAEDVAELSAMEERVRLSRDLHDSIGHHLTAISIQLEKAVAYQEISEADSIEAVVNARKSAGEALQEVRNFVGTLKDKQVAFSFKDRVETLVQGMDQDQLTVDCDISGDEELYPQPIRRSLYYALQELITNIQKHAEATEAKIKVRFGRKETTMVVEDNGVGFSPAKAIRKDGHFGLKHLRERIALLDGTLNFRSKKGKGTVIHIYVPRGR